MMRRAERGPIDFASNMPFMHQNILRLDLLIRHLVLALSGYSGTALR
jgi:hypothetical protein